MPRLPEELRDNIRALRRQGLSYGEIRATLGKSITSGTLSYICKDIPLSAMQLARNKTKMLEKLAINRQKAVEANRAIHQAKLATYEQTNAPLVKLMQNRETQLVALAMLYLGEGAKWSGRRGPSLGSSDPAIIRLYISLLRSCYKVPDAQLRCRIQHRADQNPSELLDFWADVTGLPTSQFYPSYADKRTIGKTTKKPNYKGVCVVTCPGTHIQLELAVIADIICRAV